jgi:hypothetical protein
VIVWVAKRSVFKLTHTEGRHVLRAAEIVYGIEETLPRCTAHCSEGVMRSELSSASMQITIAGQVWNESPSSEQIMNRCDSGGVVNATIKAALPLR